MSELTKTKETLVDKLVRLSSDQASEGDLRAFYEDAMYSFFGKMTYQEQKEYEEDLESA
jgi:hypothetical protein